MLFLMVLETQKAWYKDFYVGQKEIRWFYSENHVRQQMQGPYQYSTLQWKLSFHIWHENNWAGVIPRSESLSY